MRLIHLQPLFNPTLNYPPTHNPSLKHRRPPKSRRKHRRPNISAPIQQRERRWRFPHLVNRRKDSVWEEGRGSCCVGGGGGDHFLKGERLVRERKKRDGKERRLTRRELRVAGLAFCQIPTRRGRSASGSASPCGTRMSGMRRWRGRAGKLTTHLRRERVRDITGDPQVVSTSSRLESQIKNVWKLT